MHEIALIRQNDNVQFCRDHKESAYYLLTAARKTYGLFSDIPSRLLLPLADRWSKKWLFKTHNPYYDEIRRCAEALAISGVYALNISYEWGCTSGAFEGDTAPTLLRILDWPFPGLGDRLFVVEQSGAAGNFYNITWPGIIGVFQAMAPQRFSAVINQAPMRKHGLTPVGDWVKNRYKVYQQKALPPSHLLRQVFEQAKDYAQAKQLLTETPICLPVIYVLAGTAPGEACVIERLEDRASVREMGESSQVSVSNHFQTELHQIGKGWAPRAIDSEGRAKQVSVLRCANFSLENFDWLAYPMVNHLTRLCMVANAQSETLMVQGWGEKGPVTNVFNLNAAR